MPYDAEDDVDGQLRAMLFAANAAQNVDPNDPEARAALVEIAAIELTPHPGARFGRNDLLALAQEIGGDDVEVRGEDIDAAVARGIVRAAGAVGDGWLCMA